MGRPGAGHPRPGRPPAAIADAGYGDNTTFRLELEKRGWQYVVAVKSVTSAYAAGAQPVTLRQLAIAHADQVRPVTWRQGTRATSGNPAAAMTSHFLAIRVRPAN